MTQDVKDEHGSTDPNNGSASGQTPPQTPPTFTQEQVDQMIQKVKSNSGREVKQLVEAEKEKLRKKHIQEHGSLEEKYKEAVAEVTTLKDKNQKLRSKVESYENAEKADIARLLEEVAKQDKSEAEELKEDIEGLPIAKQKRMIQRTLKSLSRKATKVNAPDVNGKGHKKSKSSQTLQELAAGVYGK